MSPTLADLLQEPQQVAEVQPESIPALLGDLERLKATLWTKLVSVPASGNGEAQGEGNQLLTVEEAAQKLKVSKDWLYRRANKLPFTVRLGPRQLRFSARGIERYVRQHQGR